MRDPDLGVALTAGEAIRITFGSMYHLSSIGDGFLRECRSVMHRLPRGGARTRDIRARASRVLIFVWPFLFTV